MADVDYKLLIPSLGYSDGQNDSGTVVDVSARSVRFI